MNSTSLLLLFFFSSTGGARVFVESTRPIKVKGVLRLLSVRSFRASFVATIHWRVSNENPRGKALGFRRRRKQSSVCNEYGAGNGSHTCRFGSSNKSVLSSCLGDGCPYPFPLYENGQPKRNGRRVRKSYYYLHVISHRCTGPSSVVRMKKKNDLGGFFRKTTLSFIQRLFSFLWHGLVSGHLHV